MRRGPLTIAVLAALVAAVALWIWLRSSPSEGPERVENRDSEQGVATPGEPPPGPPGPAAQRRGAGDRPDTALTEVTVDDTDAARGAFSGTVLSWGTGRPVARAELAFEGARGLESVTSDGDGRFLFEPADAGRYRLALVSRPGFLPYAPALGRSPIEAAPRPRTLVRGMTVYLTPAIDYRGRVVDADGQPVTAAVRLLGADSGERELAPIEDRFEAGNDGRFVFHAPDGAVLEARTDSGQVGRGVVDDRVQTTHELVIEVGDDPGFGSARISGRVVGPGGQPIPMATVTSNVGGTVGPAFAGLARVTTGDDGRFEVATDAGRRAELRVRADGFVEQRVRARPGQRNLEIVLERGNTVAGVVASSSGEPVPSFHVAVFTVQSAMQRTMVAHSSVISADGEFRVDDLPPGKYQVQALAHGMARSQPVTADSGDDDLRITLESGATLRGKVIDADTGRGIENAKVTVESMLGSGAAALPLTATAITDASGQFQLSGLGPGPSSVVARAYAHHGKIVSGLHADPGAELGPITIELDSLEEGESPQVELAGIGAAIGAHQRGIAIQKIIPGGGAADADLSAGDIITRIDSVDVLELGFEGSLQRIRGPVGTTVVLTIDRQGDQTRDVSVSRKKLRF